MARLLWIFAIGLPLLGCDDKPEAERRAPEPAIDTEIEAARVLLRYEKSRIDGVMPPATWPEPAAVRRVGSRAFVTDIDTSRLPAGYPQQLVVEISGAGGHTGRPLR